MHKNWLNLISLLAVLVGLLPTSGLAADPLGGADKATLAREPQLTPAQIGDGSIDGLQFPDPTEGLALIEPPAASNDGGAHLEYPFVIPKGRGITPELSLDYDSGGENGWVGLGWDLSAGEISVDTRWGAPYFDPGFESETYAIDGQMLIPNALGASWAARTHGDRQDYTRQVETAYQQIIRHEVGTEGPKGYFWEVHDKSGNVFWYGGQPDQGGPDGYNYLDDDPDNDLIPEIDRSAIVTDEHGNGVRWLLSAQRDIGVNLIRYHYTTLYYIFGSGGWTAVTSCTSSSDILCARHTYLSSITYTEAADVAPAPDGDAQYKVVFLLESEVSPGATVRADPIVDAMGGYVDLTIDRLARVEVRYGDYTVLAPDAEGNEQRSPRTYNQLTIRYDLSYTTGPFGKSLLSSVSQVGSDGTTTATHTFTYYDRVRDGEEYAGFHGAKAWHTGGDLPDRQLLDLEAAIGALGSSESNSGEGHAYVGFNPASPTKVGSFGGAVQVGGGATEAIAEWLDINGDGLPDKVYRDSDGVGGDKNDVLRDGPIRYRLNTSKPTDDPGAEPTFGDELTVMGITRLSVEGNFGLEGSFQAFPGATVAFGLGAEVSWGDAYFSDVNGDGLPDYISGGQVWFNYLNAGVPTFEQGSANTFVPIEDASATIELPDQIIEMQEKLAAANPLVDTVRRWTAPFGGTISINAPVTLSPLSGSSTDGLRVAVQHNGDEIAAANLFDTGSQAFTAPISRDVDAGDHIYFRLGSVNEGVNDDIDWSPTITYTAIDGVTDADSDGDLANDVPLDVNGLSQIEYVAADDFTLSGRPDTLVFMPFRGTVHFSATIDKLATTDDVKVVLLHNGNPVAITDGDDGTTDDDVLAHNFSGQRTVSATFEVAAPVQPTEEDPDAEATQDSITVKLMADTPVDLHAISWNPRISYTEAWKRVGPEGNEVPIENPQNIAFDLTPEIEQYPNRTSINSSTSVSFPWVAPEDITRNVSAAFHYLMWPFDPAAVGDAIITVKTRDGVVARKAISLPGNQSYVFDADIDFVAGTEYWFDVSIRNPALSERVYFTSFLLTDRDDETDNDLYPPAALHWTGRQGIFPLAYRGWAVAGYNGDGLRATQAMNEGDFVIDIDDDNPPEEPADPGFSNIDDTDPAQDKSFAYVPSVLLVTIPGQPEPIPTGAWMGNRANLAASAEKARSSRLGADTLALGSGSSGGAGRAVTRVSITAPSAKLSFGIGPLGASFGVAPSFGLVDYEDMNGDGFPDIITPNKVVYTTQRGAYLSGKDPDHLAVTNQDLTFATTFGFSQGLVDIKANAKGKTNATKGGAAGKGSDAEDSGGGVGVGVDFNASWTSPNASEGSPDGSTDPSQEYADQLSEISEEGVGGLPGGTAPIQLGLADVNGDGLPDRVFTNPNGVFAHYNLGYRFAPAPVKLATGGFEAQESYAGGLSLGFSTPWADFSGGVALNWNVDLARYAWVDVNGDDIPDQIHKRSGDQPPTVRFGTGSGTLAAKPYGPMATAEIVGIGTGQQVSLDRSNGLGGQFDFTVAIGPLCLVGCYVIINPGASYQNSVSTTEVDLQDVNGDGYADSLHTLDDDVLTVALNKQADTNLLASVGNPLGGTITMTYGRDGNTVDHPDSVWNMASLEVHDGRAGDGIDVRRTSFTYAGLKFDRLHRTSLGYAEVTETEMDVANDTDVVPSVPVRETVHTYLNGNVFEAGLETSTLVNDVSNGGYIKGVRQTWLLQGVQGGVSLSTLNSVDSLGYSVAPRLMQVVADVGTGEPDGVGQSSTTTFTYNDLGDMVRQADLGEDDDPDDDVIADYVYSRCEESSDIGCAGDLPHNDLPAKRQSPFWAQGLCPTWASLPVEISIHNGKDGDDRILYRHRNGAPAVCDNASVTHLEEEIGNGEVAVTDLTYDAWGSYDRIVYPLGGNGRRYAVQYVWDPDGHSNIAQVTEYDLDPSAVDNFLGDGLQPGDVYTEGLTSSATFDPLTNRVASRTDANGTVIRYTYDPLGRTASISSPLLPDTQPLVTFEYWVKPHDPHAVARHYDIFHPGDTIDTAAFADGVGRVVQTQQDATLTNGGGQPPTEGMIVSGATFFDALGRPVRQYNPTRGVTTLGTFETSSPLADTRFTETVYDLWDAPDIVTEPGGRETTIVYDYGRIGGDGPTLYETTETAPNGRETVTYTDFRDVVRAILDRPVDEPEQLTLYRSDGMGQLFEVTDPSGYVTVHTYDLLGRRLSTETPDGGLVEFAYDADGQQISKVTPNLRSQDQQITYEYTLHKLARIDYPGTGDDVTYTYGGMGAPDNGAGQVVRSEDGSRIQANVYDRAGNIIRQATTMKLHNWMPAADQGNFTWTTEWEYDGLGRLKSMVYPDGERLAYGYDAGGLVNFIDGEEDGYRTVITGYDELGQPIYSQEPWTWHYEYLRDRQYDEFLRRRYDEYGNGATTELDFDTDTLWLSHQVSVSPNRNTGDLGDAFKEIQDLSYTYDIVGNPKTYRNDVPGPTSSLFSGPAEQAYTYDGYGRLIAAAGKWQQATGKLRQYTLDLTYDDRGNVTKKAQEDWIQNGKKKLVQKDTTYSFTRTYNEPAPHQATGVAKTRYAYDANGNLTGILDAKGKFIRQITWDAADRMRTVTDGPALTDYTYDDSGQRAIERGPAGETATINPWVTVRNGTETWKHVFAANDRLGTQRDDGGILEVKQYFLHKDLQGSTNIVTDITGNTFQHHEYFATGEVWVDEKSTVFRTPYQYGGGYVDEVRHIINFGARWYDQNRELFYSPDPVLADDPMALVAAPSLRAAYAFAGSNPVTYVDPSGALFTQATAKAYIKANFKEARATVAKDPALRASLEQNLKTRLPKSFVRLGLDTDSADLHQKRFDKIKDVAKPFVEINISTGEVKLSPGLFKQFTVKKAKTTGTDAQSADGKPVDATNGGGGPSVSAAVDAVAGAAVREALNVAAGIETPKEAVTAPSPAAGSGKGLLPAKHTPPNKPLPPLPQSANTAKGSM